MSKRFKPPTPEELELQAAKIGLPPREAQKFFLYYESKGWLVGKSPMKQWRSAMAHWKIVWQERNPVTGRPRSVQPPPRLDCGPEPELGL